MYLKKIILENIGAYKSVNSIDLETKNEKNVVLIGGENGAGKTTFLNAIKLGLFGSYGFGYKSDNEEYFTKVEHMMNNSLKKSPDTLYRIKLIFSMTDNYKTNEYELERSWKLINGKVRESISLKEDSSCLIDQDLSNFYEKLKDIMPPQLLDFCLFDGEEIARIVSNNELSDYIKKLSKVVFNLSLFENLEKDLQNYSKQRLNLENVSSYERELYEANQREKKIRENITLLKRDREYKRQELELTNEKYLEVKSLFEKYGGLVKTEREEILDKISKLETIRKERMDKIRRFVSTHLPFFLVSREITETKMQIQNEEAIQLSEMLEKKLDESILKELLKSNEIDLSPDKLHDFKEKLLGLVTPPNSQKIIHGASFAESVKVEQVYNNTKKEEHLNKYIEYIYANQEALKQIQNLRKQLAINDSTAEFSEMIRNMEKYNYKISELKLKITDIDKDLETLLKRLDQAIDTTNKVNNNLNKLNKASGSLREAQKIILLSRRYLEVQNKQKLKDVEIEATKHLKLMMRKHDYISKINIDSESYDVTLYDINGSSLEKSSLSAGEKQILLISLIWAIFKCSGRQVPFIFDTLLGRLDRKHKSTVLQHFIPYFGKQSIILATDSEIDDLHYNLLSGHISKEYSLEFDSKEQVTTIKNHFFKNKALESK